MHIAHVTLSFLLNPHCIASPFQSDLKFMPTLAGQNIRLRWVCGLSLEVFLSDTIRNPQSTCIIIDNISSGLNSLLVYCQPTYKSTKVALKCCNISCGVGDEVVGGRMPMPPEWFSPKWSTRPSLR